MDNITELGGLPVHKFANIFPLIGQRELEALSADIKENGLHEPIWVWTDDSGIKWLIDGRNRFLGCELAEVEPTFREYEGDENSLLEFILSLNLHRRHLSIGQKSCMAAKMMPTIEINTKNKFREKMKLIHKGQKVESERSVDVCVKMFSVSKGNVYNAKKLLENRYDLFEEVMAGNMNINQALKKMEVIVPKLEQIEVAKVADDVNDVIVPKLEQIEVSNNVLSKLELRKVSELVQLGVDDNRAIEYIVSKRKVKSATVKNKSSYEGRVEVKMSSTQKQLLVDAAKSEGISVSEYIRKRLM